MTNLCNICDKPYEKVDGVLICEDGHVLSYAENIAETQGGRQGKAIKGLRTPLDIKVHRMMKTVCLKLYLQAKEYFSFKCDIPFEIYMSYFSDLNENAYMSKTYFIYVIFYYTLRIQYEKDFRPLLVKEFHEKWRDFGFYKRVHELVESECIGCSQIALGYLNYDCENLSISLMEARLKVFGEDHYSEKYSGFAILDMNDNSRSDSKKIFRCLVRREYSMFNIYLKKIIRTFCIEESEKLLKAFEIFIAAIDLTESVFIPEHLICGFLYVYLRNFKDSINIEGAVSNIGKPGSNYLNYLKFSIINDHRVSREDLIIKVNEASLNPVKRFRIKRSFKDNIMDLFCLFLNEGRINCIYHFKRCNVLIRKISRLQPLNDLTSLRKNVEFRHGENTVTYLTTQGLVTRHNKEIKRVKKANILIRTKALKQKSKKKRRNVFHQIFKEDAE